ncbi:hypothetical protein CK203_019318 [Vitis vinifera]|uniref:Reverse transcriptase zinc-binding domain-containing protein n=1 Tax=Vitis vinifera TaxID=29760 RepID=A0A438J7D8_VITVI|nr:hypothetical protein CK203_019318 [Vitis vinifera]
MRRLLAFGCMGKGEEVLQVLMAMSFLIRYLSLPMEGFKEESFALIRKLEARKRKDGMKVEVERVVVFSCNGLMKVLILSWIGERGVVCVSWNDNGIGEELRGRKMFEMRFLGCLRMGNNPSLEKVELEREGDTSTIEEMWDHDSGQGDWKLVFVRDFNDWEMDMVGELLHTLRVIGPLWRMTQLCGGREEMVFSKSKEAYKLLDKPNATVFPARRIWVERVPTKVCFFAWEATWGKVLTLDRLQLRGVQLPNCCYLCGCEEENVNHILYTE